MAHEPTLRCKWCKDRPGGCMMCVTPEEAVQMGAKGADGFPRTAENCGVCDFRPPDHSPQCSVPAQERSDEASRNIAAMPEDPKVVDDYPRSAWDATDPDMDPDETDAERRFANQNIKGPDPLKGMADALRTDATKPRPTDPATSFAAAESVSESTILRTYRAILILLDDGDKTLEQMVQAIEKRGFGSPSGTRTRCSVLVDFGYVEDSGETAEGDTGRQMTLWRITGTGRQLLDKYRGVV